MPMRLRLNHRTSSRITTVLRLRQQKARSLVLGHFLPSTNPSRPQEPGKRMLCLRSGAYCQGRQLR
ncbi:hypothetical protein M3J09_002667 [Ascochyta lentis]